MAKKFILYGKLTRSVRRNFNSLCYRNRGEITILVCELSSHPHRPGTKTLSDMWRSNWKVDFHCSVIFTRVNRIETMYGRSRVNVKEWTSLNLYVYAWSFIHCRFIYARTFYVRTHVKKKATVEINLYSHRWPLSQVYVYRSSISDTTFRPVECIFSIFKTTRTAASCCC